MSNVVCLCSWFVKLPPTGNGFAKAGLLHLKFLLKLHQAKTIFVFSKLQKNKKRNGFLRLIMTKLSTQEKFTPAFAKPMLCAVSYGFRFSKYFSFKYSTFLMSQPKTNVRKAFSFILNGISSCKYSISSFSNVEMSSPVLFLSKVNPMQ